MCFLFKKKYCTQFGQNSHGAYLKVGYYLKEMILQVGAFERGLIGRRGLNYLGLFI